MKTIILFSSLFILTSCWVNEGPAEFPVETVMGYKALYAEEKEIQITFESDRPMLNPGKIYLYGNYLLINELFNGVHIFNNTNPSQPIKVGFISILGCVDIGMEGNRLVANYQNDLVTIDITDINNPVEIDRLTDVFTDSFDQLPPQGGYFECLDPNRKHLLAGWEYTQLQNPECYR